MSSRSGCMIIPLERISYVTTPTLAKKDLLQWIHISGRPDLSLVFEKESYISSNGHSEQQTLLKIGEGTEAVETVVLEDFVCQAAVAEQRGISTPNSPPQFAIFTSSPNLAFRYKLLNGHFRKIQLLFKDAAGFDSAVTVLKEFNLPLVNKTAVSRRDAGLPRSAQSTSYASLGGSTILSAQTHNNRTVSTSQSWHDAIDSARLGANQHRYNSTLSIGPQHPSSMSSAFQHVVLRPGPSLVESCMTSDRQSNDSQEQYSNTDHLKTISQDLTSQTRQHTLRRSLFDGRSDSSVPGRANLSREMVSPMKPFDTSTIGPSPSWLSRDVPACHGIPESGQRRLFEVEEEPNQSLKDAEVNNIPESRSIFKTTLHRQSKLQERAKTEQDFGRPMKHSSLQIKPDVTLRPSIPKKVVTRKRAPRKTFRASAVQTEYSSNSLATQTMTYINYVSKSVQTDSATFIPAGETNHIEAQDYDIALLPEVILGKVAPTSVNTATLQAYGSTIDTTAISRESLPQLLSRNGPKINRFGRQRRAGLSRHRDDVHGVHSRLPMDGVLHVPPQSHLLGQVRRVNKFGRRTRLVHV